MELRDEDLRIDVININPDERISIFKIQGVRIVHVPTGIEAMCAHFKSHHKNRTICTEMIEYALASL